MPIIKSAVKRVRQTKTRTARNNIARRQLKEAVRELDAALSSNDKKNLPSLLSKLQGKLDMAVKKNLMHKNKAARIKKRYASLVKEAGGQASSKKTKKAGTKKTASKSKTSSKTKSSNKTAKKK